MEQVLDVYERAYNPLKPVVCFDERPCQLIGDVLAPLPMQPGKVQRQDYHYQRNGTCVIFMAFEPLSGTRIIDVREQKTKKDYAEFMKNVKKAYCDSAEKIILVQDNLNTHNPSSFYETFSAQEAFELSQYFELVYTPKKASWLNMAELEFSSLSKQCLNRRIGNMKFLSKEVYAWSRERNRKKVTVHWQFTKNDARIKLGRYYVDVRN